VPVATSSCPACRRPSPTRSSRSKAVAGKEAVALIRREPDERIMRVVDGRAFDFAPELALSLGFRAESTFAEIIEAQVGDEHGGKLS
jgi:hypothetical protein